MKKLLLKFFEGSLLDPINNNIGSNSGCFFKNLEKGISLFLPPNQSLSGYGAISDIKTIVLFLKPVTNVEIIYDGVATRIEISAGLYDAFGATTYYVFVNEENETQSASFNTWQCLIIEFSGGINFTNDLNFNPSDNLFISYVAAFDKILSTSERNKIYNQFVHSYGLKEVKRNIGGNFNLPTDLSKESNISAAFNANTKNLRATSWIDVSQNGYNGTVTLAFLSNEGLIFKSSGSETRVDFTDLTIPLFSGQATIACRFKKIRTGASSDETILGNSGLDSRSYLSIENGSSLRISSDTVSDRAYSDSFIDTTELTDIVITADNGIIAMYQDGKSLTMVDDTVTDDLTINRIGMRDTSFRLDGVIVDLRIYGRKWNDEEIKNYHNCFAKQLDFIDNQAYESADGTNLTPREWTPGNGSYKIEQLSSSDSILPELKIGQKYYECTSAGTIAFPKFCSAIGEWEFALYKHETSNVFINIVTDDANATFNTQNSYCIGLFANENLFLRKGDVSYLFQTGSGYISVNTLYFIKITRTIDGEFTAFIKGGSFGSKYQLINVSSGSGSNPVTDNDYMTGNYFVTDFDSGDRISLISKTKGVIAE